LQPTRPGAKRFSSGIVVALAKLDHVAATQVVSPVQPGKPGGGVAGDEVGSE
jgi:hypothetical protein